MHIDHRLWRSALLQDGGFVVRWGDVDSTPSVFNRNCLSWKIIRNSASFAPKLIWCKWKSTAMLDVVPNHYIKQWVLTLSENFGLGIASANDLNCGVTWRGEGYSHPSVADTSLCFISSQTDRVSDVQNYHFYENKAIQISALAI